jgi:hypothetical protein
MVASGGQQGVLVNAVIAQANAGIIVPAAGAVISAGPPPVPIVIAVQPLGLPPLAPLEAAFTEIRFSVNAARVLTAPNNNNITQPSLALMDYSEVKTFCATMRKPGGGEQGTNVATRAEVLLNTV